MIKQWWEGLLADVALLSAKATVEARSGELRAFVEHYAAPTAIHTHGESGVPSADLDERVERAKTVLASAHGDVADGSWVRARSRMDERLFEIEEVLPLLVGDQDLRLRLEAELDRKSPSLCSAHRERAKRLLLKHKYEPELPANVRSEIELLVCEAVRERNDRLREERAMAAARTNFMTWLVMILGLLLAATCIAAVWAETRSNLWPDVILAATAGALGGTLSGLITMRTSGEDLNTIARLGSATLIQPVLGAVGGLVLTAIWRSGVLELKGLDNENWAAVAVVAFAGGSSEPLLFQSLKRLTGTSADTRGAGSGT